VNIYSEIIAALEKDELVMLATIISASGSTPAAPLSKMLVKNDGSTPIGTVGGGSMEHEVKAEALRTFPLGKAKFLTYHLQDDEVVQGLICGGNIEVLIEPITRGQLSVLQQMTALIDSGEEFLIVTLIHTDGTVKEKKIFRTSADTESWIEGMTVNWMKRDTSASLSLQQDVHQSTKNLFHQNESQRRHLPFGDIILEPIFCRPELYIFGSGHVGKALCRIAAGCGFRVCVIDDRVEYANSDRFPEAEQILVNDFLEAFDHISIKSSSSIVIATRGHSFDEAILGRALQTSAKYIGMMGSRRKVETIFKHLTQNETPPERLQHVYAPIGIDIGAVTPDEIAISIVAQLIRMRRGEQGPVRDKSDVMYSFFHKNDVLS
jgi:xanthine dehydrogenase accessory factor